MIRMAQEGDITQIMEIIRDSTAIMKEQGNPQWSDDYPTAKDFLGDIGARTLYVWEDHDEIAGLICVNRDEPKEYATVTWSGDGPLAVLHRMAVAPDRRGQQIGRALLTFAEEAVKKEGIFYIRTDTYSQNQAMNHLLQKQGYVLCGHMTFKSRPGHFNCYEKFL